MEINKYLGTVHFVQGALIKVNHTDCLIFGFEESGKYTGDNLHLMLIFHPKLSQLQRVTDVFTMFSTKSDVLTRIHSECILGDALQSTICDCNKQLQHSISLISKKNEGLIFYLRQEGRGIGLRAKLSALALQGGFVKGIRKDRKYTPDEANRAINFPIDARNYEIVGEILSNLKIHSVKIITGNLEKINTIKKFGIQVSCLDIPRDEWQDPREILEIREKLSRNYYYEEFSNAH